MSATHTLDLSTERTRVDDLAPRVTWLGLVVGLAGLGGALLLSPALGGLTAFFQAYLVAFLFFLTISLGGLFFVIIQHLTRSGWSVVVRRLAELIAFNVHLMAVLFLPILLLGVGRLYEWSHHDVVINDPILSAKAGYLNYGFFAVRTVLYFAIWLGLSRFFLRLSLQQDETGDPALTMRMQKLAAPFILLYGLSVTFAAFDLVMSLLPHWFSTIFGVYVFAGSVISFQATLIILLVLLQARGRLAKVVTVEHYHDLGKLLFAFTVFWAYIGYSQYMLQWYANIPEETEWYYLRQQGGWTWVSLGLLLGGFVFPFLALISRVPKRVPQLLVIGAVWQLGMHLVDLAWLCLPLPNHGGGEHHGPSAGSLAVLLVLCLVGVGGLFIAALAHRMKSCSLLAARDPRLGESLTFENV